MNELLRKRAIMVMDKLMSHPSTAPFRTISENENKSGSIADLNSIIQRLRENQYATLDIWTADVERCWSHAERKRGKDIDNQMIVYELMLAEENRRIFEKERHILIDLLSPKNWGTEVVRLRTQIAKIMAIPPPKVLCDPSTCANLAKQEHVETFSEHELHCFVEASQKLETEEQNTELIQIIREMQPELLDASSNNMFDVSKLSVATFKVLRTYVKSELEKIGEKYPE